MGAILEFIPLAAFLLALRNLNPSYDNYWLITYGVSASAALLCIGFKILRHEFQNKIILGINCYLLSGALGIVAKQTWLMRLYGSLQSAAMLLWIMGIGVLAFLFSTWFPANLRQKTRTRLYEKAMTLITLGAFALAYSALGNTILSETIPFATLFISYFLLFSKLQAEQVT
jgi:hypothetical protein